MIRSVLKSCLSELNRFPKDRSGNAAIEFAFIAPLLTLCLLSVTGAGAILIEKGKLQRAATVAVQWGSQSEFTAEEDMAQIATYAGRSYGGDAGALSITAQTVTLCSDGADLSDLDRAGCETSDYLQVLITREYAIPFDLGLFRSPIRLTEQAVRRHMY